MTPFKIVSAVITAAVMGVVTTAATAATAATAVAPPITASTYLEYSSPTSGQIGHKGKVTLTEGGPLTTTGYYTQMSVTVELYNGATFDNTSYANSTRTASDAFVFNLNRPATNGYSIIFDSSMANVSGWTRDTSTPASIQTPFQPSVSHQTSSQPDFFTSGVACTGSACNTSLLKFIVKDTGGISFGAPVNDGIANTSVDSSTFISTAGYTGDYSKYNGWWFAADINELGDNFSYLNCGIDNSKTYAARDLIVFTAVPEPETYALMLAGLGLIGFVARRRSGRSEQAVA